MDTPREKIRICLAGCGHWGRNLARNLSQLGSLYAICESMPERLQAFVEEYPAAVPFGDFNRTIADPAVDAVMIAAPAERHYSMASSALAAGTDVYVEKPLTLDWREGLKLVEEAEARGRILMVGHLLRYHPAILKIQEMLASGALGRIEYIYSNRLSMGKIRQEENALWSFAPHDISVILALMGRLPVQITATGGAYLQPNIADVTVSNLLFDNGSRAHIFVSWLHPYKEQRLVVIGSRQMVVFEDSRPDNKLLLYDKNIEWKNGAPAAAKGRVSPVAFDPAEPLLEECAHFIDCVRTRRGPRTPGQEGVQVLQVLEACQRSMQMNGEPVQLTFHNSQRLLNV
jgi:UDP-2-acetamido-3-amino-2,3-dideoxy-glucuronate N-acetyltransferase